MSDAQILLVVVVGFYVAESLHRGRPGQSFDRSPRGEWRAREGAPALHFGNPLPFLCEWFHVDEVGPGHPDRLALSLEPERQDAALNAWRRALATLKTAGTCHFAFTFVVAPAACIVLGFEVVWLPILVTIALLNGVTATLFFRRHAQLHRPKRWQRVEQTLMIAVSPASAMRAAQVLDPAFDEPVHPLAVAALLLNRPRFEAKARTYVIDFRVGDDGRADADALFAPTLIRHDLSVEQLLTSPRAENGSCLTWCPRCNCQFTIEQGTCGDCGDTPLVPLSLDRPS